MIDYPWKTQSYRQMVLCGAVLINAVGVACTEEPQPPEEPQPRTVKYVEVVAQSGTRMRTFTGFAKADVRAEYAFRVSGMVQRVYIGQGDIVAEGDVIAEIDPVDLEIQLRETEASLAEAKAQAVLADSDFQRTQRLYEKDNISRGEFESALAKRESAHARVESVEQKLQQAKRQLDHTRLRAPTGCAIIEVKVEEGESVQAGTPVVEVVTGGKPHVEIAVPERFIAKISEGASASVRFPAVPGHAFLGRVTTVGVVPAQGVTTYPATIELNSSWTELMGRYGGVPIRPGMAVEAQMEFGGGGGRARHVVAPNAVVVDGDDKFVYVVETGGDVFGVARRRSIETGQLVAAGIEVLAGLTDGDKVITAGLNQIRDGQQVRLLGRD